MNHIYTSTIWGGQDWIMSFSIHFQTIANVISDHIFLLHIKSNVFWLVQTQVAAWIPCSLYFHLRRVLCCNWLLCTVAWTLPALRLSNLCSSSCYQKYSRSKVNIRSLVVAAAVVIHYCFPKLPLFHLFNKSPGIPFKCCIFFYPAPELSKWINIAKFFCFKWQAKQSKCALVTLFFFF